MSGAKTRKVCARLAALLIIFAVSLCFLRPAPSKPVLSSLSDEKLMAVLQGYGFDMGEFNVEHLRYELGRIEANSDTNSFLLYSRTDLYEFVKSLDQAVKAYYGVADAQYLEG